MADVVAGSDYEYRDWTIRPGDTLAVSTGQLADFLGPSVLDALWHDRREAVANLKTLR